MLELDMSTYGRGNTKDCKFTTLSSRGVVLRCEYTFFLSLFTLYGRKLPYWKEFCAVTHYILQVPITKSPAVF